MNQTVQAFEQEFLKKEVPDFRPGDTVRVAVRIVEGDKERIQNYEGICIGRHGTGMDETFTVRRVSFGVGMERIFPLHSPRVESVKILRQGRVRRAKLYYLRELSGRKARIPDTRRKRGAKDLMLEVAAPEPEAPAVEPEPEAVAEPEEAPVVTEVEAPEVEAPAATAEEAVEAAAEASPAAEVQAEEPAATEQAAPESDQPAEEKKEE